MKAILELSKTLNYNKASKNLFISQPTLTYQIKTAEDELEFIIFNRTHAGVQLTNNGLNFVTALRSIYFSLADAIEQGRNFSNRSEKTLKIGLPNRSSMILLPEAIKKIRKFYPDMSIIPEFSEGMGLNQFFENEIDILFSFGNKIIKTADAQKHLLFKSSIYLVCRKDDELAKKDSISIGNLEQRNIIIDSVFCDEFKTIKKQLSQFDSTNILVSPNFASTLTQISSSEDVALTLGFMNNQNNEFKWIPFKSDIKVPCYLITHSSDNRESTKRFVDLLQKLYQAHDFLL